MLCRFELEVSDARENVSDIDNQLVMLWLDRLVLAIELNLEAWVAKSGKNRDKTTIGVLRGRQLEMTLSELAAVNDAISSGCIVNGSLRGQRVLSEPLPKQVSVLAEAKC